MDDVKNNFLALIVSCEKAQEALRKDRELLEEEKKQWEDAACKLARTQLPSRIKLDVGGQLFATSLETLTETPGTYFSSMFSGRFAAKPTEDGAYFIDRDPSVFKHVLNYLRGETTDFSLLSPHKRDLLLNDAMFYQVDGLINILSPFPFTPRKNQIIRWKTEKFCEITKEGKLATATSTDWLAMAVSDVISDEQPCVWKVAVNHYDTMIGIAAPEIIDEHTYFETSGFFIYSYDSKLYANGKFGEKLGEKLEGGGVSQKQTKYSIVVRLDQKNGKLYFGDDVSSLVLAFDNIPRGTPMAACVNMRAIGSTARINDINIIK